MPRSGWDGYYGAFIFFACLQWIAATGRFAIRIGIVKRFGVDDAALLVTLIVSSAFFGCHFAILVLTDGARPVPEIEPANLIPTLNTTVATLCAYVLGALCLKIALGLLVLRILVRKWQIWTVYGIMALNIGYGIGYFFVALYQCGDPSQFAIRHILGGCLSTQVINGCAYTHSVINALSDAILVLLPIHAVWKSNMSNRSKWSVAAIIGIASIGVVCTIIRIGYVYKLSASSEDYYVMIKPMVLLSGAELSIGITCVSLCTYRPLFSWLFGKDENYYYPNDEESNAQEKSRGTLDSSQVHFDSYRSSRTLQDFEGGSGAVSQILKDVPHVRSEHQPQIEEKPEEESEPSTGWQSPNPSEANNGIPTVATSRDLSS